jgi:hypothetical protein
MNPKEKIESRPGPLPCRHTGSMETYFARVLFLALLIPAVTGQLAAAEDQPVGDHVLIIDVYSGAVAPDVIQEKVFWLWLATPG